MPGAVLLGERADGDAGACACCARAAAVIASNLGQIIGGLMLAAEGGAQGAPRKRERVEPADPDLRGLSKHERILAALRGNSLNVTEITAIVGGSHKATTVYLANMKNAGQIKTEGTKGQYRYSLA